MFRWYSFAIHGTNDPSRVGQSVTGGCINVNGKAMDDLLDTVKLGDEVVIASESPCTP
jgi:lipoprotein-anchoring transpeptidase ErfK/SrfK